MLSQALEHGHPATEVKGPDMSPFQPAWAPPNVTFFVADFNDKPLIDGGQLYDLIHGRNLTMAIRDWDVLLTRAPR